MVEPLVHARPPCAFLAGVEWLLARVGERPPLTGDGVGGHPARVGGEILAVVFPIGEQEILRRPQEDGVIANVAGGDAGQHFRPDCRVERFVFVYFFRPQPVTEAHSSHFAPSQPLFPRSRRLPSTVERSIAWKFQSMPSPGEALGNAWPS